MQEILKQNFKQIALETLCNEKESLNKQNNESLEAKIKPLTEKISEFQSKIDSYNILGTQNTTKIIEQIGILEKNNKTIEKETKNLVEALSQNRNVKGKYGENLLEDILKLTGMVEGIHYNKQFVTSSVSLSDGEEHTVRPDFVVNLPNEHKLVIDSKVTLSSYLKYVENPELIKDFKTEFTKRITELSDKNYQNADGYESVDFVFLYVPIESCINLIYQDSEIIDFAYKSNVIIVGTGSLLTSLRLVCYLVSQQKQQENLKEIVNAGTNLYETFVQFCDDLTELQKRFDNVSVQFGKTINRFKRNNPNKPSLFSQVKALKELGISSSKEIPGIYTNCGEEEYDNPEEEGVTTDG